MKLQMGPLSDVAFLSSIWHICFLSQGPFPSCSLDKGVSAELLKNYNAVILDPSLVQKTKHKKKKECQGTKETLGHGSRPIICVSFTPAMS